jgi:hypothetical protein
MINKIIEKSREPKHNLRNMFNLAGYATAIYLNNKARNLPSCAFQISLDDLANQPKSGLRASETCQIEPLLPLMSGILHDTEGTVINRGFVVTAFEVDIINLLIGPLAEARHVAEANREPFTHHSISLQALKFYNGALKLDLVEEYLQSLSDSQQEVDEKRSELYSIAFNFINDPANWRTITNLANYACENMKTIITSDDAAFVCES